MEPSKVVLHRMFEIMATIKQTDEKFLSLLGAGTVQFVGYYSPRGQEAISAGTAVNLSDDDYMLTTYRGLHDHIAKGVPLPQLWAECLGKVTGFCQGRGGPMHVTHPRKGMMVTTGIVGGGLPIANGFGWASQLSGDGRVTVVNFGDGASNIGAFHEALNLASVWRLPVIFMCQNNRVAEHARYEVGTSIERIGDRGSAYGMPGVTIDGNDPLAVWEAMQEAVSRARNGEGPTLIEAVTFRFNGHAFGMPTPEVSADELAEAREWDPYPRYRGWLVERGYASEAELSAVESEVATKVDEAVDYALSSDYPEVADLERYVFAEVAS
jgi:pyruvate dehydrogenase E1 component alpha subunit